MECPDCHGFGFIRVEPYDAPDGQNIEPHDMDCTRCAGSGELESARVYASALRLVSSPYERARAARYMAQLIPHVNLPTE